MKKKNKKISLNFSVGDMVVYPSHGVGQIDSIESLEINKIKKDFLSIQMEQDNLKLKIPFDKVNDVGLRKLASRKTVQEALKLLKGKARVRRMMWSRRAQEYTGKINSGSLLMISEVVRDLYRKNNQPEQSYSERQMFQSAVSRLARELAAVEKIDHFSATEKIESILQNK
tara:strand:+ start:578 stop:1090 length:513 start_codon:yes stop_codon:yes gene_type:complete